MISCHLGVFVVGHMTLFCCASGTVFVPNICFASSLVSNHVSVMIPFFTHCLLPPVLRIALALIELFYIKVYQILQ